jgi:hypothetical protein
MTSISSVWPHHQIGQRPQYDSAVAADDVAASTAAEPTVLADDASKRPRTSAGVFDGFGSTLGKVGSALNPVNWFAGTSKTDESSGEPGGDVSVAAPASSGVRVVFDPAKVRASFQY